jgi:BMFP domain-containing protein YqiC
VSDRSLNYFNYFTEIEEHFQQARGTSLFLLSPLDWALIESWKNSGVPLEAVLRGIDAAFEKWRAKRTRTQMVNSLAFCAQAVLVETQRLADAGTAPSEVPPAAAPFPEADIKKYLDENAVAIRVVQVEEFNVISEALEQLSASLPVELEDLERRLSALEQKLIALARIRQTDEQAVAAKRDLDSYLKPYRGKMTAPQLAMLEAQFMDRAVLEANRLPRLSLFHLR